jgi:hypothetical protein
LRLAFVLDARRRLHTARYIHASRTNATNRLRDIVRTKSARKKHRTHASKRRHEIRIDLHTRSTSLTCDTRIDEQQVA